MSAFNLEYLELHQDICRNYNVITDQKDSKVFADQLFMDDAEFGIANFPKSVGKDQIAAGAQGIYNIVKDLKHDCTRVISLSPSKIAFTLFPCKNM